MGTAQLRVGLTVFSGSSKQAHSIFGFVHLHYDANVLTNEQTYGIKGLPSFLCYF